MAEFTGIFVQQVAAGQNAMLSVDVVGNRRGKHTNGSGFICIVKRCSDLKPGSK